jgi:hypothetical protein
MSLFKVATNFVGDVGFSVIKQSSRIAWGGGQAIVGMVSQDDELIEQGLKKAGKGTLGLVSCLVMKNIDGDNSETDGEEIDVNV